MKIALTGGIAEGKSTVLAMLKEMGFSTASSDDTARRLFREPEINARLAAIVGRPPPLEPAELRAAIAGSNEIRRAVNRLMHPLIGAANREIGAQFVEVPLLVEACLQWHYDEVWVVTCGPEEQRRRLTERYGSEAVEKGFLERQLPTSVKVAFADRVVRTNVPFDHVRKALSVAVAGIVG